MENVEHHHQAATRLSLSPPPPPPRSAPLSPDSAAAEALANARWTPTKEQIGVLEDLYRKGMRTPTAEQIQLVTMRLREHGPIEGKNVFYWFQNHKARQRQKQKQQTFEYFARQFHRPQPLPMLHRHPGHPFPHAAPPPSQMMTMQAPPPQHPACNGEVMYRQQQGYVTTGQAVAHAAYYSQTQLSSHYQRDNAPAQQTPCGWPAPTNNAGTQQQLRALLHAPSTGGYVQAAGARPVQPQTLNLFPLHPTFAQREKTRRPGTADSAMPSTSASFSWESESLESHNGEASVPFFNFFSLSS